MIRLVLSLSRSLSLSHSLDHNMSMNDDSLYICIYNIFELYVCVLLAVVGFGEGIIDCLIYSFLGLFLLKLSLI